MAGNGVTIPDGMVASPQNEVKSKMATGIDVIHRNREGQKCPSGTDRDKKCPDMSLRDKKCPCRDMSLTGTKSVPMCPSYTEGGDLHLHLL